MGSSKVIIHFIPLEAFTGGPTYDMRPIYDNPQQIAPMGTTAWSYRLNLDVAFGTRQPCKSYTQLFRKALSTTLDAFRTKRLALTADAPVRPCAYTAAAIRLEKPSNRAYHPETQKYLMREWGTLVMPFLR